MGLNLGTLSDNAVAHAVYSTADIHVDQQTLRIDGGGLSNRGTDGIEGVCGIH